MATRRPYRFPTCQLYESCKVLTVRQLFVLYTVLKQHASLTYNAYLTNTKRRKDIVCSSTSDSKFLYTHRFFAFLGPYLYNKINKETSIYDLNYAKSKMQVCEYLLSLNYERTEELLTVVK